ncbi:MAG: glycoside hydrolase family 28 protein [Hungatella sp.]
MKIQTIFITSRSMDMELMNMGIYQTEENYQIYLDGTLWGESRKIIETVDGLKPDTTYSVFIKTQNGQSEPLKFHTNRESYTLNVRDFGALGDGQRDDTTSIQAAIYACEADMRVLIPKGVYKITSLFMKSDVHMELAEGAVLSGITDRSRIPVFPGMIENYEENEEYNLGSWEGNPLTTFTALITCLHVSNVTIYGRGRIDGCANYENWWKYTREKIIAYRPRLVFISHCSNIVLQGIRVENSPSWNIHPYFSQNLRFINLTIRNPKDSPNTDGLDPESCKNVEIAGVHFSLGDDCIAIKSGKIYMGATYRVPSEQIEIRQCCMCDGHGSITLGSEMAAGIRQVTVKDCLFLHTDRGLRIKTRRGRGKDAVIDQITFERIRMDHVLTPFVINNFYFCDPDGHTEYVRTKEKLPVDARTPEIKCLLFKDVTCTNCHVAAAYFYGLPEQKIEQIIMENIHVSYAKDAQPGMPAMMEELDPVCKMGVYANNVHSLIMKNVQIEGCDGEPYQYEHIDALESSE